MELVESTRRTMMATSPDGIVAALRGMAERPDVSAELPAITEPVLCLCGEHDIISPPAEMRAMAAAMPRAEFRLISDAGHMAPLEQPAAVNDAVRGFLRQLAQLE
jgi:pimeloyl-ACP methyl ester carboxylesterase